MSGTGGAGPAFVLDAPNPTDYVVGESNVHSLDFEQNTQDYLQISDAPSLGFGAAPFTIEAWVKLETLPTGANLASTMPVVMKKVLGQADTALDYMFLAAAGSYGNGANYDGLALHLGSATVISSLVIPDNAWHYISVAFDPVSDIVRFTLDSQVDVQTTPASGIPNSGPVIVGAHFDGAGVIDSAFDGLIDELSITDGFVADGKLQPLANAPVAGDFCITDLIWEAGGATIELTFQSEPFRLYDLEVSPDLQPGNWQVLQTSFYGAPGNSTVISGVPGTGARAFYRLSIP